MKICRYKLLHGFEDKVAYSFSYHENKWGLIVGIPICPISYYPHLGIRIL